MAKYKKGIRSRELIIEQVNQLYNEKGINITLDELANEIGLSKGHITNYFPKKELLLLGIFRQYETRLGQFINSWKPNTQSQTFRGILDFYSCVMDLNFEYRFAIIYISMNPLNDESLILHIRETYEGNRKRINQRLEFLIKSGLIENRILEPEVFDAFFFQFVNLSTTWMVNFELYDKHKGYQAMKPVYLRGIMNCYSPYLTAKGREEMDAALAGL